MGKAKRKPKSKQKETAEAGTVSFERLSQIYDPHNYAEYISGGDWKAWRWLIDVSRFIADRLDEGGARIIVNGPPRHGKSELISVNIPPWYLEHHPDKSVVVASYGNALARDFGQKVRDQLRNNPRVGIKLREDADAAGKWLTPQGGGMTTVGVNGPITGRGFNLGIVDDPIKDWKEANSRAYRKGLVTWFTGIFEQRCEPDASIIINMTRWHKNDLTGYLLKNFPNDWVHVKLPALAVPGDWLGRKPGEALCPERFDEVALAKRKTRAGFAWPAIYQQEPEATTIGAPYDHYGSYNDDSAIKFDSNRPIDMALDFNINPGMHVELGHYDSLDDLFLFVWEIFDFGLPVDGAMKLFIDDVWKVYGPFKGGVRIFGDPSGRQRSISTGKTRLDIIHEMLRDAGIPHKFYVKKEQPSPVDRIGALNQALRDHNDVPHVLIHSRCENLIDDLQDNEWNEDQTNVDKSDSLTTHAAEAAAFMADYLRPILQERRSQKKRGGRIILG